jgi:hypothetical protein
MKPAWMLTGSELNQILETGGLPKDYQTETSIAQAKKLLEFQINIAVFKGHISLNLLKQMLSGLEDK